MSDDNKKQGGLSGFFSRVKAKANEIVNDPYVQGKLSDAKTAVDGVLTKTRSDSAEVQRVSDCPITLP